MARIRSVKPEFWQDPKMGRLPRDARLLYISLWNQADEHGRAHGDARVIKGQAFPYDDDLGAAEVDELLNLLHSTGRIVRYVVQGDAYLYLPNLAKHQRLEAEKVASKHPALDDADESAPVETPRAHESAPRAEKSAPMDADESSLLYGTGSMEHVPPRGGAIALRTDSLAPTQTLIGEWIDACKERPPKRVIGQVSREIKALLEEDISYADVRNGLALWHSKALHPSTIASVVHESRQGPRPTQAGGSPKKRDGDRILREAMDWAMAAGDDQ